MKPRARRVTIAAAVLGAGVAGVLVVAHWGAVRDHVEAWHFQLTRETETIDPAPGYCGTQPDITIAFCIVAGVSGRPVIFEKDPAEITMDREKLVNASAVLEMLRGVGYRILEQRFPRRAYVVIRDECAHRPNACPTSEGCDPGITLQLAPTVSR